MSINQIARTFARMRIMAIFTSILLLYGNLAAAQDSTIGFRSQLKEISITSKYYKQYQINTVSSALRLQTPLINLSQNIQEISTEVIRDQASFNMTEGVSRNVSGVIRQEVSNNLGPYLFMRGGQVSTLRNGIDLTPIYRGPVPEDVAIIDRVEFIKGPSLFMSNIGDPAGTFNVMTKQPTGQTKKSVDVMLGSRDFYRIAADFDGQLSRRLYYRVNGMAMTTRSFVKYDFNKRYLIAPVIKYKLSDRSAITAEYMFQSFRYGLMSPIVMSPDGFGTLPNDFTISEKSLPPYHVSDHTAFLTYQHAFNDNWHFTVRGAWMQNKIEGIYMWVTGVNNGDPKILLRNPKYDNAKTQVFSEQAFVNGKVGNHQILAGIDVNQKQFIADSYFAYDTTYYRLDISNPVYGTAIPGYHSNAVNTDQTIDYYSLYALDEIHVQKFRFTIGGRYTAISTHNQVSGVITSSADRVFTPRLAISYSILEGFTAYTLYDRTIVPQAGMTSTGEAIQPLKGRSIEAGLKKNWMNGRWNTTIAYYDLTRRNIIGIDPDNSSYKVQIGGSSSRGVDIDIMGQLFKGMNVIINYAYNDARVDNDVNKALIGKPTPMYVKHVQNTWLNYELPCSLSFSLGYQYQGKRGERYATATPHATPDYFRVDGGIGYKYKKIKVYLLVNNLLDKHLIATPWYRNGLYYWVPQAGTSGRLSINYNF
ncbi:TonB-dependent receptor [Chitinophaga sp.]|uniref:TonB-dependent siderophore receptor n=1 Tax=Chitinophaga sp. TaxID=1869181 RepID=UPI0031D982EC